MACVYQNGTIAFDRKALYKKQAVHFPEFPEKQGKSRGISCNFAWTNSC